MKNVQVLLSTYNGHRYLRDQMDSILLQKDVNVTILVRDDGSTDNTVGIIKEYERKYSNVCFIPGNNVGFAKSFWSLLTESGDVDYYAFCDQDDIWAPDKLVAAIDILDSLDNNDIPLLYTSNAIRIDENSTIISNQAFPNTGILSFEESLIKSILPGCTFVFNHKLCQLAKMYDGPLVAHDWLVYMIATGMGQVVYDETPHIKYRIHSGNAIGVSNKYQELKKKVRRFFNPALPRRSEIVRCYGECFESFLSMEKKEKVTLFSNANKTANFFKLLKVKSYRNFDFVFMMLMKRI